MEESRTTSGRQMATATTRSREPVPFLYHLPGARLRAPSTERRNRRQWRPKVSFAPRLASGERDVPDRVTSARKFKRQKHNPPTPTFRQDGGLGLASCSARRTPTSMQGRRLPHCGGSGVRLFRCTCSASGRSVQLRTTSRKVRDDRPVVRNVRVRIRPCWP
jgi:hypothetical protein